MFSQSKKKKKINFTGKKMWRKKITHQIRCDLLTIFIGRLWVKSENTLKMGLRTTEFFFSAASLFSCVTLDKWLNLSGPLIPQI